MDRRDARRGAEVEVASVAHQDERDLLLFLLQGVPEGGVADLVHLVHVGAEGAQLERHILKVGLDRVVQRRRAVGRLAVHVGPALQHEERRRGVAPHDALVEHRGAFVLGLNVGAGRQQPLGHIDHPALQRKGERAIALVRPKREVIAHAVVPLLVEQPPHNLLLAVHNGQHHRGPELAILGVNGGPLAKERLDNIVRSAGARKVQRCLEPLVCQVSLRPDLNKEKCR
mmetsp:Transcript_21644/g.56471  ORF Transcript_21644/g.56471 Transcript_21644/m.56471 type:complete len:228 (+) Transcript_21644:1766-2449(+)